MPRPRTRPLSRCSALTWPCSFPTRARGASCASLPAQEYRVLTDIMLLQAAAENYCLEPQHSFTAWFWAVERLSEENR